MNQGAQIMNSLAQGIDVGQSFHRNRQRAQEMALRQEQMGLERDMMGMRREKFAMERDNLQRQRDEEEAYSGMMNAVYQSLQPAYGGQEGESRAGGQVRIGDSIRNSIRTALDYANKNKAAQKFVPQVFDTVHKIGSNAKGQLHQDFVSRVAPDMARAVGSGDAQAYANILGIATGTQGMKGQWGKDGNLMITDPTTGQTKSVPKDQANMQMAMIAQDPDKLLEFVMNTEVARQKAKIERGNKIFDKELDQEYSIEAERRKASEWDRQNRTTNQQALQKERLKAELKGGNYKDVDIGKLHTLADKTFGDPEWSDLDPDAQAAREKAINDSQRLMVAAPNVGPGLAWDIVTRPDEWRRAQHNKTGKWGFINAVTGAFQEMPERFFGDIHGNASGKTGMTAPGNINLNNRPKSEKDADAIGESAYRPDQSRATKSPEPEPRKPSIGNYPTVNEYLSSRNAGLESVSKPKQDWEGEKTRAVDVGGNVIKVPVSAKIVERGRDFVKIEWTPKQGEYAGIPMEYKLKK